MQSKKSSKLSQIKEKKVKLLYQLIIINNNNFYKNLIQ